MAWIGACWLAMAWWSFSNGVEGCRSAAGDYAATAHWSWIPPGTTCRFSDGSTKHTDDGLGMVAVLLAAWLVTMVVIWVTSWRASRRKAGPTASR